MPYTITHSFCPATHTVTREHFVDQVRKVLQEVGIDQSTYSGHSFRIGAATTVAAQGIQDSLIMGQWQSVAYLGKSHVRTLPKDFVPQRYSF